MTVSCHGPPAEHLPVQSSQNASVAWRDEVGSPGAGGSLGFADPAACIGFAYVTSQSGATLTQDRRVVALRNALYSAIPASGRAAFAA